MFTPKEILLNYKAVAQNKATAPWYKLLILGILAGAFIAFGGAAASVCSQGFTGSESAIIKAAVFPVGLILVVVCGAELFTGNCLLFAPAVNRDISIKGMLKNLGIVYVANFIGAVVIAFIVVFSHIMPSETIAGIAVAKTNLSFLEVFLRGVGCNILVCLAVWGSMAARSVPGKILAVYFPVFAFVACGFEHSVANMYYLFAGLMAGGVNFGGAMLCLLSSTLGNVVGGALIALAYNAVYAEKNKKIEIDNDKTE